MPFAIFAIYCHMLFYSRSASALRIAELDVSSCPAYAGYTCNSKCCPTANLKTSGQSGKDIKTCAGELEASKSGHVSFEYDSSSGALKCNLVKQCDKALSACTSDKIHSYTKTAAAKKDPHVINMAGEKFDILATGTFSLVSLTRATEEDLMIKGTIARFGTKCGESFITYLEHTGGWIRNAYNTGALKVRVVQDVPKTEALQVTFGQKWKPLSNLQDMAHVSKTADAVKLDFSSVTVKVRVGKHWRHKWNFLDLDVQGLASLDDSIRVGGLLGYDDHTHVLQGDAGCARFAETDEADTQSEQSCLSSLKAT